MQKLTLWPGDDELGKHWPRACQSKDRNVVWNRKAIKNSVARLWSLGYRVVSCGWSAMHHSLPDWYLSTLVSHTLLPLYTSFSHWHSLSQQIRYSEFGVLIDFHRHDSTKEYYLFFSTIVINKDEVMRFWYKMDAEVLGDRILRQCFKPSAFHSLSHSPNSVTTSLVIDSSTTLSLADRWPKVDW